MTLRQTWKKFKFSCHSIVLLLLFWGWLLQFRVLFFYIWSHGLIFQLCAQFPLPRLRNPWRPGSSSCGCVNKKPFGEMLKFTEFTLSVQKRLEFRRHVFLSQICFVNKHVGVCDMLVFYVLLSRIDTFLCRLERRLRAPQLGRSKKGWVSDLWSKVLASRNSMEQVVALWIWTPKMRTSKLGCRLLLRCLQTKLKPLCSSFAEG